MPCLAGNFNPAVCVIVQVAILPHSQLTFLQSPYAAQEALTNLTLFAALLDTGASVTCISQNVIQTLGLLPSGKTHMSGSTGQTIVDQYTFIVAFLFGAQQRPSGAITGQLVSHLVQGCEFAHHGLGFDVLIGRDVLCKGSFSLSFDGHYLLSF